MKNLNQQNGMTLVEILIAMGIFLGILVVLVAFQTDIFRLNNYLQSTLSIQQNARKILRPFAEEIRGASISNGGAFPIAEAKANSITFYSDINNDGLKEKIRYFLEGDEFKKGVIEPTGNPPIYDEDDEDIVGVVSGVVNDINNPIFTYFGNNYDGTNPEVALTYPISLIDVTLVEAVLMLDDNVNQDPGPIEVSTKATFRNLKNN